MADAANADDAPGDSPDPDRKELLVALGDLLARESVRERIRERFGAQADPEVTLEDEASAEPASRVVQQLSERRPSSGRYRLQGEVARGGMGAILRVWDEDLRRHLAMKVILAKPREHSSAGQSRALARFLEEAQVTGQLDHPGVVPVHELGLDERGRVYFTMKLVKGRDLREIFDLVHATEEGWTLARALGVLLKVCEAMAYAHSKGVIHRDLKPANVMVGRFGEVYVMDWGLAKVLGDEDRKDIRIRVTDTTASFKTVRGDHDPQTPDSPLVTMDGDVVGTPAFMSPEQARGEVEAMGPQSDVYSAGAMLYQLLAGHSPYVPPGTKASNYAVWRWVQEGPPGPIEQVARHASAELCAIVDKAMRRDPAERYSDMSQFAADLAAYAEGRVVKAHAAGAWAEARKWVGRNRALAASLLAALVLGIGGLTGVSIVEARGRKLAGIERDRALENERLAEELRLSANAARDVAQEQGRLAHAAKENLLRLSDLRRVADLIEAADALWPPHPEHLDAYRSWLDDATALVATNTRHKALLRSLPAHGTEPDHASVARTLLNLGLDNVTELEWLRDVLSDLTSQIDDFSHSSTGLIVGCSPSHGWGVARRLEWAEQVEELTVSGEAARRAWSQAIASISDRNQCPAYRGLVIEPQLGLLPIGKDPASGLWEFAHLQSEQIPLEVDLFDLFQSQCEAPLTLVFLLVPGGEMTLLDNYDAFFEPFFLSKYHVTGGHVLRAQFGLKREERDLVGPPPMVFSGGPRSSLDRAFQGRSTEECVRMLKWWGLRLPLDSEWEYVARLGSVMFGDNLKELATQTPPNPSTRYWKRFCAMSCGTNERSDVDAHSHSANVALRPARSIFGKITRR